MYQVAFFEWSVKSSYLREITSPFKKPFLIRFHKTLFMSTLYHLQNKSALLRAIEKSFTDTSRDEHYCIQRHALTRSHRQTTLKYHNFVPSVITPCRPSSGQYLLQLNKFPSPTASIHFQEIIKNELPFIIKNL